MRASYYPGTDSFYLRLSESQVVESEEVAPQTVLDFDTEGNVVGVEIYGDAARRLDLSTLELQRKEEEGGDAKFELDTSFLLKPLMLQKQD